MWEPCPGRCTGGVLLWACCLMRGVRVLLGGLSCENLCGCVLFEAAVDRCRVDATVEVSALSSQEMVRNCSPITVIRPCAS